jgi:hypothetical protein
MVRRQVSRTERLCRVPSVRRAPWSWRPAQIPAPAVKAGATGGNSPCQRYSTRITARQPGQFLGKLLETKVHARPRGVLLKQSPPFRDQFPRICLYNDNRVMGITSQGIESILRQASAVEHKPLRRGLGHLITPDTTCPACGVLDREFDKPRMQPLKIPVAFPHDLKILMRSTGLVNAATISTDIAPEAERSCANERADACCCLCRNPRREIHAHKHLELNVRTERINLFCYGSLLRPKPKLAAQ